MRVRYVALVPIAFEEDVVGGDDFISLWGREHLAVHHPDIQSFHPRKKGGAYEATLVEAVRLETDFEPIDLGDLIAPG